MENTKLKYDSDSDSLEDWDIVNISEALSSNHTPPVANSQSHSNSQSQHVYNQNSPAHTLSSGGSPGVHSPNSTPQASESVEFYHAANYVNKFKNRFQGQPDIYMQFLEILHTYQKEQRNLKDGVHTGTKPLTEAEVYAQVSKLLQNQDDLLKEFGQFLPGANFASDAVVGLQPSKAVNNDHASVKNTSAPVKPMTPTNNQPKPIQSITHPAPLVLSPPIKLSTDATTVVTGVQNGLKSPPEDESPTGTSSAVSAKPEDVTVAQPENGTKVVLEQCEDKPRSESESQGDKSKASSPEPESQSLDETDDKSSSGDLRSDELEMDSKISVTIKEEKSTSSENERISDTIQRETVQDIVYDTGEKESAVPENVSVALPENGTKLVSETCEDEPRSKSESQADKSKASSSELESQMLDETMFDKLKSTNHCTMASYTINIDTGNFLGISIVGKSNKGHKEGIYVRSVMKGGAVALDGRIEPGDKILEVNDINFENMSNDDAVSLLEQALQKPGPIKLVVSKCWNPNPITIPLEELVCPMDPDAFVAHIEASRARDYPLRPPPVSTLTSTRSSITSSKKESNTRDCPLRPPPVSTLTSTRSSIISSKKESNRAFQDNTLTVDSDMLSIVKAMTNPESGLEVKDRMLRNLLIPNSFIGADVVNWLFSHVQGFQKRLDAMKYATQLLKAAYIRNPLKKIGIFSEDGIYVFGDIYTSMTALNLKDDDFVSKDYWDTLKPLLPSSGSSPWWNQLSYFGSIYKWCLCMMAVFLCLNLPPAIGMSRLKHSIEELRHDNKILKEHMLSEIKNEKAFSSLEHQIKELRKKNSKLNHMFFVVAKLQEKKEAEYLAHFKKEINKLKEYINVLKIDNEELKKQLVCMRFNISQPREKEMPPREKIQLDVEGLKKVNEQIMLLSKDLGVLAEAEVLKGQGSDRNFLKNLLNNIKSSANSCRKANLSEVFSVYIEAKKNAVSDIYLLVKDFFTPKNRAADETNSQWRNFLKNPLNKFKSSFNSFRKANLSEVFSKCMESKQNAVSDIFLLVKDFFTPKKTQSADEDNSQWRNFLKNPLNKFKSCFNGFRKANLSEVFSEYIEAKKNVVSDTYLLVKDIITPKKTPSADEDNSQWRNFSMNTLNKFKSCFNSVCKANFSEVFLKYKEAKKKIVSDIYLLVKDFFTPENNPSADEDHTHWRSVGDFMEDLKQKWINIKDRLYASDIKKLD